MFGWFRKYVRKIGVFGVEVEFHPPTEAAPSPAALTPAAPPGPPAPLPLPVKDEKPRMDACYGRWTWQADEDAFTLELKANRSFRAENADGDLWKGTWYVRDGCMFVAQTHYRTEDGWESCSVDWLKDDIAEVSATAIRFKYGGVFERVES